MDKIFNITYSVPDNRYNGTKVIEIVNVIKKAKDYYISGEGMCISFLCAAKCFGIENSRMKQWIIKNISLFNYFVAEKYFNAEYQNNGFWWDPRNDKIRLKYFDWLIEQYSNK